MVSAHSSTFRVTVVDRTQMTPEPIAPKPSPTEKVLQTKRARLGTLMGVQVLGIGSSVPDNIIRNEDLAELGYDADWIVQRTGILQRRHAPPEMATSDLALEAATACIEDAGVDRQDIDLVLVGTYTPDTPMPSTACAIQDRLGLCAPAVDLQAACAGFMYSLVTAAQYVATGCCRLPLVIGADCNSRVVNPADKRTYPLFGDAAGAVVLGPGSDEQGLVAFSLGSDGSGGNLLIRPMGGSRMPYTEADNNDGRAWLHMEGRPIFKWSIRLLSETVGDVLRHAKMTLDDVDLVIFHQANMRIISSAVDNMGIDPDKVFNNLQYYGNTSAASIPLALDEAYRQGRVRRGDHVLLSGFGGGLTWGTALMRW